MLAEGRDPCTDTPCTELGAELRGLLEHRVQATAVGGLVARRQGTRMLEQDPGADRPRPEQLATGERRRKMAIRLLPAPEQGCELAEAKRDRAERLLGVGDGVVVVVWKQQLVELERAGLVADENARVGQCADVEDPQAVAGEIGEAVDCVALELAASQLVVAALGCGEGLSPAGDPRKPVRVVVDLGPELVEAALCPADGEHLCVAEDVRRVLAPAQPAELERFPGKSLGVEKAAVERCSQGPKRDRVPAVERLLQPFGELGHRLGLGIHSAPVAELEEAVESRIVSQELDLRIDRLLRDAEHLFAVRETLLRHARCGQRPVARVQGRDERLGVAETPRHLDRVLAHRNALLDGLVAGPHLEREVGEEMRSQRAVVGWQGSERFLQEPDPGPPDLEARVEEEAPERGHVAQRRLREQLAVPEPAARFDRLLVGRSRLGAVPRAPLCIGEAQQQHPAPLTGRVCHEREQLERVSIVDCGLLVGEQRRGAIAGSHQVFEGWAGVPESSRKIEVPSDLGEMRVEVVAVHALEQATHLVVELQSSCRRKIVVQRLPHQLVRERVAPRRRRKLGDDSHGDCLAKDSQEPCGSEPARSLEQMQIELAPDDCRHAEHRRRLAGQAGHAAADATHGPPPACGGTGP